MTETATLPPPPPPPPPPVVPPPPPPPQPLHSTNKKNAQGKKLITKTYILGKDTMPAGLMAKLEREKKERAEREHRRSAEQKDSKQKESIERKNKAEQAEISLLDELLELEILTAPTKDKAKDKKSSRKQAKEEREAKRREAEERERQQRLEQQRKQEEERKLAEQRKREQEELARKEKERQDKAWEEYQRKLKEEEEQQKRLQAEGSEKQGKEKKKKKKKGKSNAGSGDGVPPGLTEYVQRVFDVVVDLPGGKQQAEAILAMQIEKANTNGGLWAVDWNAEPIPVEVMAMLQTNQTSHRGHAKASETAGSHVSHPPRPPQPPPLPTPAAISQASPAQNHWASLPRPKPMAIPPELKRPVPLAKVKVATPQPWFPSPTSISPVSPTCTSGIGDFLAFEASAKKKAAKRQPSPLEGTPTEEKKKKQKTFVPKPPEVDQFAAFVKSETEEKRKAREGRFAEYNRMVQAANALSAMPKMKLARAMKAVSPDVDLEEIPPCEGTSQALEKDYLRLTMAPDPATVRPEVVLRRSLAHVLSKYQSKNDPYHYLCNQLKAIRQDLTVQRINNVFTVEVYETAAGFALEYGDQAEFNQSQANLKPLHSQGIIRTEDAVFEFQAYRLLYAVLNGAQDELNIELDEVAALPLHQRNRLEIEHALRVVQSWHQGNYIRFNRLYERAPNRGQKVMNLFRRKIVDRVYPRLLKPYRPTPMPLHFVKSVLFPGKEEYRSFITGEDMWEEFTKRMRLAFVDPQKQELETKQCFVNYARVQEEHSFNPGFS
eukprot:GGOE01015467.1.p1 GENE.GGOE01015467.1~~GGOE01015467.1.p1  ORF type:complete len:857 (+),score=197.55 GGOE01015467.1:247-2571(+)